MAITHLYTHSFPWLCCLVQQSHQQKWPAALYKHQPLYQPRLVGRGDGLGREHGKQDIGWKGSRKWISAAKSHVGSYPQFFILLCPSFPWIYAIKITGLVLRRPIGDQVAYQEISNADHLPPPPRPPFLWGSDDPHSMQHIIHQCSFLVEDVGDMIGLLTLPL